MKLFNSLITITTISLMGLSSHQIALSQPEQIIITQATSEAKKFQAEQLYNEGDKLFKQGTKESLEQAIIKFNQALILYRELGNKSQIAFINLVLGFINNSLGFKQQALKYYNQALLLYQQLKDREGEATTLNNIGLVYDDLGEKQKALEHLQQALSLYQALDDRSLFAATLNNIGKIYSDLGDKQKALEYYQQSLPLSKAVGDRSGEANTLNNIGLVYSELGEKQKALEYYQQALLLRKAVSDRKGEAITLNNIGKIYDDLGFKQKALDYYQQALILYQELGDKSQIAFINLWLGFTNKSLEFKQEALNYYNQALPLYQQLKDREGEATTLNAIGLVYSELGFKQKALEYYQQALPLFKAVSDRGGEATALTNLGHAYNDLGFKQKALEYLQQALSLFKAVSDRGGEAAALNNIGGVYNDLEEKQKALEYYQQSLLLAKALGSHDQEAYALGNIGGVYNDLGEKQKALEYGQQALSLFKAGGERSNEAATLSNIAYVESQQGNLQTALTNIKSAVDIIEDLRIKIISPDLRTSYFSTVQDYYKFYIKILMELHKQNPKSGYNITALEISERSRSRGLIDLLNEAKADIRKGVDPNLKQKEQQLSQIISSKTQYQLQFTQQLYQQKLSETEIKEKLEPIKKEINELQTQLQQIQAEIRTKNPRYAALTQPQPVSLKSIQQQLDNDSVLLEYSLGEEKSYLWLITPNSINSYELPKGSEIETISKEYLTTITNTETNINKIRAKAAIKLSKILLAPVAEAIKNKRLIIVADGNLQYIPFNFLAVPDASLSAEEQDILKTFKPLLVDNEIINLPSASTLEFIREFNKENRILPKTLAVIADPVFSPTDERINNKLTSIKPPENNQLISVNDEKIALNMITRDGKFQLNRLPGTRKEAENILALIPENLTKKSL